MRNLKYQLKAKRKIKRCKCGHWRILQIHHKDNNPQNDNLLNLVWVCPECHDKIHNRKPHKQSFHQLNKKYAKGTKQQHKK